MKPVVEISVSESGIPAMRTYTCGVTVDGQKIVSRELSPIESQQIRELYQQYISIFERGCEVEAVKDYMELLGKGLFHLFLEYAWGNLKPRMEFGAEVLIISKMPEVLGLPWEFLRFPNDSVLAFDNRFSIKRFAVDIGSSTAPEEPPSGPLRILFMACAPYDYGYEERSLLKAIEGLDVVVRICDTGNFEELRKEVVAFRPHLVHLVGQGKIKENSGYFAFEAEAGRPDFQDASSLGSVLAPAGVRCLLLGGCQLDKPQSLDLICLQLGGKIPLALSWNASAESTSAFYRTLAAGQKIEQAIQASIQEIKKIYIDDGMVCALPVMYYFCAQCQLFNPEKRSKYFLIHREQNALKGLTEGYAEDFVDRRNDLQRLSSALREGTSRVLIITGPDGVGKSVLGKRLASHLASEGYALISVYSSSHNSLTSMRILEAYINSLAEGDLAEKAMGLRDSSISFSERVKRLLEALNKDKLLLFLDDLELDKNTGRIKDQDLAEFYYEMLRQVDKSRIIIAARTLPADAMTLPSRCWEWNLGGLPESAFIKYLLNDDGVAECYRIGTLSYNQLESLFSSSAGQPFCLAQMRKALSKGWIGNSRCEEAVQFLFGLLSQESGQALSRSAVYGIAVGISGLMQVTGEPENKMATLIEEWTKLSLVFQPSQNLYAVSASVRSWLLNQLDTARLKDAHDAAGNYLEIQAGQGHAEEIGLSRLDCFLESRWHYISCGNLEKAREVNGRISGYLERRGYYREIMKLNRELLEREVHTENMNWIASAYVGEGNYSRAQEWYEMAQEIKPEAVSCHGLGTVLFHQGKYDQAKKSFEKALELCKSLGDLRGEAIAFHALASIEIEQKQDDAALEKMQKVVELQEKLGDLRGEAVTFSQMASLNLSRGKYEMARQNLIRALEILQLIDDKSGQASVLHNLASIDLEKGDFDQAYEEFQRSLKIKKELGDRKSQAEIFHQLGSIEAHKGIIVKANESFLEALKIYQSLENKSGEAGALFQLGALAVQRDRVEDGLRLMVLSALILRTIGSDEIKSVEPVVERLASQLNYGQDQFLKMVREVSQAYRKDRGRGLVEIALGS